MEYVLPNIIEAAKFDKTAGLIVTYGFQRFAKLFSKRIKISVVGCWDYGGEKNNDGYSIQNLSLWKVKRGHQKSVLAHRASWLMSGLKITEGMVLDHKCKNRYCVNPFHLREVTNGENSLLGDGPSGLNKRKTHCKFGHEFTNDNIYWKLIPNKGRTGRACKTCVMKETTRRNKIRLAKEKAERMERKNGG